MLGHALDIGVHFTLVVAKIVMFQSRLANGQGRWSTESFTRNSFSVDNKLRGLLFSHRIPISLAGLPTIIMWMYDSTSLKVMSLLQY